MLWPVSILILLLGMTSVGSARAQAAFSWTWVEQAASLSPHSSSLPLLLKLKASTTVEGDSIYLNELVDCVGDEGACDEVSGIRLLASPAPGSTARIAKAAIAKILSDEWPAKNWRLEGPDRVAVSAAEMRIAAAEVQAALEQQLVDQPASMPVPLRYEIKSLRLTGPLKLRPAHYSLQFDEWQEDLARGYEWVQQKYKTMQAMRVRLVPQSHESAQEKTLTALVRVEVWAEVLVTRKGIGSAVLLSPDDVVLDWQVINRRLDAYARSLSDIAGYWLKHPLPAGQVVLRHHLQAPMAIARGAQLKLQLNQGGMVVSGRVRALEAGRVGDVITVIYDDTKTRLRARVLNEHTVLLNR